MPVVSQTASRSVSIWWLSLLWFLRFPRHTARQVRQTPRLSTRRSRAARDAKPFRAGRAPRPRRWLRRRRSLRQRPRRAATRTPGRTHGAAPWRTRRFASWILQRSRHAHEPAVAPERLTQRADVRPPSTKGLFSLCFVPRSVSRGLPIYSRDALSFKNISTAPPPAAHERGVRLIHEKHHVAAVADVAFKHASARNGAQSVHGTKVGDDQFAFRV